MSMVFFLLIAFPWNRPSESREVVSSRQSAIFLSCFFLLLVHLAIQVHNWYCIVQGLLHAVSFLMFTPLLAYHINHLATTLYAETYALLHIAISSLGLNFWLYITTLKHPKNSIAKSWFEHGSHDCVGSQKTKSGLLHIVSQYLGLDVYTVRGPFLNL